MDVMTAIAKRRSIRKFQNKSVPETVLRELISYGRLYASGGNAQPIRFGLMTQEELREKVFREVKWAMYLPEFEIKETQKPQAYILLFRERENKRNVGFDVGAASTNIMLAATAHGLGSCCLASFREELLRQVLPVDPAWKTEMIIALGYPDQQSDIIPYADSVRYTQNLEGNISVPKLSTDEVLIYSDL